MIIETRDGKTITGWRAWLLAIPLLPVVAVYILAALVQIVAYTIMGKGQWKRNEQGGWTWTRDPEP